MWKPLSIISGLLLLTAGGLMYSQVRNPFLSEIKQLAAAKENRESANKNQLASKNARTKSDNDLADAKTELATNTRIKTEAQAAKSSKEKEVSDANASKEDAAKKLAEIEDKLKGLGGLEQLVADYKVLQAKEQMLTSSIANTKGAIESTIAHKNATDKVITGLKLKDLYQKTGTVVANFRTRVTEVSPELGFVVLGDGNASNVTKGAKFDIRRGDSVIAKIVVTHLEQNRSIAEVIQGTAAAGQSVLPGDVAVVSASSSPRSLSTAATSTARPAPKKEAAEPAADPAAPVDPFASPGGTEPAPAPATEAPAPEAPAAEATEEMKPGN